MWVQKHLKTKKQFLIFSESFGGVGGGGDGGGDDGGGDELVSFAT